MGLFCSARRILVGRDGRESEKVAVAMYGTFVVLSVMRGEHDVMGSKEVPAARYP